MLFSSLTFLFLFLPTALLLNLVSPKSWRNGILIILSILFYAWGGPTDTLILLGSILLNFLLAKRLQKSNSSIAWLQIGIALNVLILLFFKYSGFIAENIVSLLEACSVSVTIKPIKVRLPLGISFFTFQQMSMLWDIYRSKSERKITLPETALYVGFFPQLIAGPIVRYHDIIDQIQNRTHSIGLFHSGIQRFIIGLFKKVIIANTCAVIADKYMDMPISELNTSMAWLGIVAYSFQIYYDFSGYSDMAIGIGRMLGFRILENFNFPYISRSIQEFWRRWHMSLSSWFKDYVYIPLGGNRGSVTRTYANLLIVFLLTGLWHGATWSFIFWGLFHGFFLVLERLGGKKLLDKLPNPISWSYAILVVIIGWVYFRIEEFGVATDYLLLLFGYGNEVDTGILHLFNRENVSVLFLALIFSTTLPKRLIGKFQIQFKKLGSWSTLPYEMLRTSLLIGMLFLSVLYENANSYNPFIYFRF
ncbi:MAG: alginate O-acetyltransferase complex protein AlgI [Bacteroidia bacterium]|jgi:alginate O-acetyltransferase complex protein AlgI